MHSLWRIFWLELTALRRSKTVAVLWLVSVAWMFALPFLAKGDGTEEGLREVVLRYSLGGVFLLLVIALVSSATGSLARERALRRLQLTLVRPVRYSAIVWMKGLAHIFVGAFVLATPFLLVSFVFDPARPCFHVCKPVLPSPREEAKAMYEAYMNDPETPPEIKRTKKSIVMRLLENRAVDHYQTIATNETALWRFDYAFGEPREVSVRLRFTNQFDMRDDVRGVFELGELSSAVSNITQAVLLIPLGETISGETLSFRNQGSNPLMLRPRKDVDLLVSADGFLRNLLRTYIELVSILSLLIFFALFLSAALGRPVAIFVAFVTLLVGEMSPSVIEQYPDELETDTIDRIGLVLTRFSAEISRPVSSLDPLARLAVDECVESGEVAAVVATNIFVLPFFLALVSGFLLPRKQDES